MVSFLRFEQLLVQTTADLLNRRAEIQTQRLDSSGRSVYAQPKCQRIVNSPGRPGFIFPISFDC